MHIQVLLLFPSQTITSLVRDQVSFLSHLCTTIVKKKGLLCMKSIHLKYRILYSSLVARQVIYIFDSEFYCDVSTFIFYALLISENKTIMMHMMLCLNFSLSSFQRVKYGMLFNIIMCYWNSLCKFSQLTFQTSLDKVMNLTLFSFPIFQEQIHCLFISL